MCYVRARVFIGATRFLDSSCAAYRSFWLSLPLCAAMPAFAQESAKPDKKDETTVVIAHQSMSQQLKLTFIISRRKNWHRFMRWEPCHWFQLWFMLRVVSFV
jgi:hypothetical protein